MKNTLTVFVCIFLLLLAGCTGQVPVKGTLTIHYELAASPDESIQPSYLTVIWLSDQAGNLLHTLLVSDYLSYGGYNDTTICTNWNTRADWDNVSEEIFDAVTQATPPVGINSIIIDCSELDLLPGKYTYCVEAHIFEKYNILAKGEIELGNVQSNSTANIEFFPEPYKNISILKNVQANYIQ